MKWNILQSTIRNWLNLKRSHYLNQKRLFLAWYRYHSFFRKKLVLWYGSSGYAVINKSLSASGFFLLNVLWYDNVWYRSVKRVSKLLQKILYGCITNTLEKESRRIVAFHALSLTKSFQFSIQASIKEQKFKDTANYFWIVAEKYR